MDIRLYKLADGRLWSVESGRFIEIAPEGSEIIMLYADGMPAGRRLFDPHSALLRAGSRKSVGYGVSSLLRRVCRQRRDVRSPHHPWRFQRNRQRQCLRDGHFLYDIPTPLSSPHALRVLSTCSNQSLAISGIKSGPRPCVLAMEFSFTE